MIRVFPIAAPTFLTNSFGEARGARPHQGNDLFAEEGAPLVAVDDGLLRSGTDPLGGNIANLYASDGTRYYYAHLLAFADQNGSPGPFAPPPRQVRAGDTIGFVGRTGNAQGTQPHLHFEEHPGNGPAVDPFPALERAPRVSAKRASAPSSVPSNVIPAIALLLGIGTIVAWSVAYPRDAQALWRRLTTV